MAWAYFCWRDGGGLVTSTFPPTAGLAVCCGCRIFGGLAAAGQNDRGGLPRPRRNYGGFLTGGRRPVGCLQERLQSLRPDVEDDIKGTLILLDNVNKKKAASQPSIETS
ncbi:hypothetical protein NDU88_000355 [Pleurodeles waltl]|uniref:Uncharacterized protein n=1 Tax=Pleurodeles waltl TaxID=8319 RepID=A0AAV7VT87_PLEWA|nr:hypothetical protein NDU88_000355 [Pleurodeles waltl]